MEYNDPGVYQSNQLCTKYTDIHQSGVKGKSDELKILLNKEVTQQVAAEKRVCCNFLELI